ncbi:carbohydrate ABC transporter permease [Streptomyces fuscigenes]|uniref:carbohydrate ABC transporter permease n=1 Tax=Streptomyces fuscigenes TaxID=1528880 RepID=UPI001F254BB6|nr:sugar ABC transporter permease [Streptomyces fuscigenes]MCF3960534.1 sugar ABC transporter permease [Streptomyces fuscigenes]
MERDGSGPPAAVRDRTAGAPGPLGDGAGARPGRGGRGRTAAAGRRGRGVRDHQGRWGWLFATPMVVILGLFLVLPIGMAAWVSLLKWDGQSNPFSGAADFVGVRNYADLLTGPGQDRQLFMTSIRNNLYYVLLVVPLQTVLSLGLALAVHHRRVKGKGFFRTVFYFPSVTSSIAISTVFLFLFQGSGAVNALLKWVGITGPRWFTDAHGLVWSVLGLLGVVDPDKPVPALAAHGFLGLSWWDWLSGPSIAMCTLIVLAVWTTSGTYMLMFLAALQDVPVELEEAALLDGANRWQSFRNVTLPAIRPVVFLVATLGLIGTWQVFDAVYVMSQGAPANTTLTPAYLSYTAGFQDADYGRAAAIGFVLLAIILVMTLIQRLLLRERGGGRTARRPGARGLFLRGRSS